MHTQIRITIESQAKRPCEITILKKQNFQSTFYLFKKKKKREWNAKKKKKVKVGTNEKKEKTSKIADKVYERIIRLFGHQEIAVIECRKANHPYLLPID